MTDGPKCPACGRNVRPGIRCQQTVCPYEHSISKLGYVVLSRPLRQRIR
jgi:hypothetical protein